MLRIGRPSVRCSAPSSLSPSPYGAPFSASTVAAAKQKHHKQFKQSKTQTTTTQTQTQTPPTKLHPSQSTANIPAPPLTPVAATSAAQTRVRKTATQLSPLWSWGWGHLAGLGHGDYIGRPSPTPIASLATVDLVDLSSSWGRNVAVTKNGSVIHWGWKPVMRSWLSVQKYFRRLPRVVGWAQRFGWGRLTLNGADPLLPTRLPNWGFEPGDPEQLPGEEEPLYAVSASAGSDWCAVLSNEGQVYTFGAGFYGQLGHSGALEETLLALPTMVSRYQNHHPNESHGLKLELDVATEPSFPNSPIVQVATGFSHMLILTKQGQVYSCGKTDTGALGITHIYRDGKRLFLPHLIPVTDAFAVGEQGSGEPWIKVSSVEAHEAQSTQWLSAQNDPSIIETYVGPMVQVCAGMKHSLFLNAAGEVYACGTNGLNELGNGTYHPVHGLVRVRLPLAAPGETTAARRRRRNQRDATAAANDSTISPAASAAAAANAAASDFFSADALTAEKIIKIATGMHHCIALSNYGHVYAWGSNLQGQCGVECAIPASGRNQWSGGLVQRKSLGERSSDADLDAVVREQATSITPDGKETTRSKLRGFFTGRNMKPAFNHARRQFIESQCISPVRLEVETFELGIPKNRIGRVVDVQAGFYDSVLITDAGHCITFGGGNTAHSQHKPHLFTLKQPTPDTTQKAPASTSTPTPSTSASRPIDPKSAAALARADEFISNSPLANALDQPYRIRKLAFGLGHTIALVDEKK